MRNTLKNMAAISMTVGVLLVAAGSANAKPVCIQGDGGIAMKFAKIKTPKPGSASALIGISSGIGGPVVGGVSMNSAGTQTLVEVFLGGTGNGMNSSIRYEWLGDATLAGAGTIDTDGDNVSDGVRNFTVVDCATVSIP